MSSTAELLTQAQSLSKTDPKRAEQIFRDILNASGNDAVAGSDDVSKERALKNQETALVKLGELYRDQKCVIISTLCKYIGNDYSILFAAQKPAGTGGSHHTFPSVHVFHSQGEDSQIEFVY